MHIPDGFLSPELYLPSWAISGTLIYAIGRRCDLLGKNLTLLSALAALSFVAMMVAIPLPGGTSAHMSGIALMVALFGAERSFLAISMVLVVEAFIFGEGGITTLGANILAIGAVGGFSAAFVLKLFGKNSFGLFLAAFVSTTLSAAMIAMILGVQSMVQEGYFPFDLKSTLYAIIVPHLLIGAIEGVLTILLYRYISKHLKDYIVE